jgi:hypothetical protein
LEDARFCSQALQGKPDLPRIEIQAKSAEFTFSAVQGTASLARGLVPKLLPLAIYSSSALAAPAADCLDYLLPIVV